MKKIISYSEVIGGISLFFLTMSLDTYFVFFARNEVEKNGGWELAIFFIFLLVAIAVFFSCLLEGWRKSSNDEKRRTLVWYIWSKYAAISFTVYLVIASIPVLLYLAIYMLVNLL